MVCGLEVDSKKKSDCITHTKMGSKHKHKLELQRPNPNANVILFAQNSVTAAPPFCHIYWRIGILSTPVGVMPLFRYETPLVETELQGDSSRPVSILSQISMVK
jgi:hypothetical protein